MRTFLRDDPTSAASLDRDAITIEHAAAIASGNDLEEMRTSGLLAEIARVNGEPAQHFAQRSLVIAEALGNRDDIVLNTLRLATASFYEGQHAAAEQQFRTLIDDMQRRDESDRLDTAYQHLGKCLAEQERYDDALLAFDAALRLRCDPALRASTTAAITEALARRDQD